MRILPVLLILALTLSFTFAWEDCPYGLVNDTYPGYCSRYTDTDKDNICDHSQPAPAERLLLQDSAPVFTQAENSTYPDVIDLPKSNAQSAPRGDKYDLFPIGIGLLLLYTASFMLSRKKIIGLVAHRRLWNILLLITFLVSAILGIILVIRINTGIVIQLPFDMLFWHVEAGIAMTAIAVFHIAWHWSYFKSILKKSG